MACHLTRRRRIPCAVSDENGYRVFDLSSPVTLGARQSLLVSV
jgi:hypothetical protein